jgi:hypothetical protein
MSTSDDLCLRRSFLANSFGSLWPTLKCLFFSIASDV